ncbi:discoidin domain-containing protein [Paenibacillus sp. 1001270B_150601_E10]|uniref:discoidin domain-containing protein n=1 Tax=Paenibacillus sp. 1001270B_150601_E10 TaxID=2787079 RepID=UPI00189D3ED0|nr:discoidin domain-containing protein [Paenibacillus sp. 1001270B_150601_E10]
MRKTVYANSMLLMLSMLVVLSSLLTAAQPARALSKPIGLERQNVEQQAADLERIALNNEDREAVSDDVYDQAENGVPNGEEQAAKLLAKATFNGLNLALNKPAFSSGNEVDYLSPALAVDGKGNTRWSSKKNDNQWFYVDLGKKKAFDRVVLRWQTPADKFKILVSNDAKSWTNVKPNDGIIQSKGGVETIDFPAREARYVKFQGVARAPVEGTLYGYSFYEFEVYQQSDLQSVIDKVTASLTVQPGQTKLDWSAANIPNGYRVSVFGSDRLPVIDLEGHIRTPLVDAKVNLILLVEDLNNPDRKLLSNNISINVSGLHKQTPGRNAEPEVIPSLREWYGDTGHYKLTQSSRIVIAPNDEAVLRKAGELTREDLLDLTGYSLEVVAGKPHAGDIYLAIDPSLAWLGDEGNVFKVDQYVSITSSSATGAFFGTRTALQIIKQHDDHTIPRGEARDYPKYEQRGLMIDVARKYFTIDFLQDYVKLLSWYKMNMFQIHLNDGVGTPFADGTHAAYRLESTTYPGLASSNGHYTKKEFKELQLMGMDYGVNIIPEIDTPGHSRSFTTYNPALGTDHHLDISKPETIDFVKNLFNEYLDGDDLTFVGPDVHIGTDEYWGTDTERFRWYMDTLVKHINSKGKHPHMWGGLTQYNGTTPISNQATMDIWREPYGAPQQAVDLGFDVINSQNVYMYIVPTVYRNYLNAQFLYDEWEPVKWETTTLPLGHPRVKGGMFSMWNDASDVNGLSMDDAHIRLLPGIQVVAEKMWTGTRKDKSFARFEQRTKLIGEAPNADRSHSIQVDHPDHLVMQYMFEQDFKDESGNGFDGNAVNVDIAEGKYGQGARFNGGQSYIETPIEAIGFGWTASMWIKPDRNNPNNAVLMESPVGTLKLKQGSSGKLGFTKEHYNSTFNYVVPEGKWTHILLKGDDKGVSLFVNLDEYVERLETQFPKMHTFVLPTLRIGSETHSFKGELDNVFIYNKAIELLNTENLALQKATESSQTEFPNLSSDKAVDGNESTRWLSKYVDAAWYTVDLGEVKDINKVVIKWQTAYAEQYQILVSTDKKKWTNISGKGKVIHSKGKLDILEFDVKQARYVKFQGVKRATVFGNSFFEFEVYSPGQVPEYKQLISLIESYLPKVNENFKPYKLLLQVLNRYPYDAKQSLDPMKTLIKEIQGK